MMLYATSDLSFNRANQMQSQNLRLQQTEAAQELTTGTTATPRETLSGSLTILAQIERERLQVEQRQLGLVELKASINGTLAATEKMTSALSGLDDLLVIAPQSNLASIKSLAEQAGRSALDEIVSSLNTNVAGQFVFSGVATDVAPLPPVDQFLDYIDTNLPTETDPAIVVQFVDDFFAPGGDFETSFFMGSAANRVANQAVGLGAFQTSLKADDDFAVEALRTAMTVYALGSTPVSVADTSEYLSDVANDKLQASSLVLDATSSLGFSLEGADRARVETEAQLYALNLARSELLSVDQFEVAAELEEINTNLEFLYATTARISRLSFLDFVR